MNPESRSTVTKLTPDPLQPHRVEPELVRGASGWDLVSPRTGKVIRSFRSIEDARELFPEAVKRHHG